MKVIVNGQVWVATFEHGTVPLNLPKLPERKVDYTRCRIYSHDGDNVEVKMKDMQVVADVTVKRHYKDTPDRRVGRFLSLTQAMQDLPREVRKALWKSLRIRVPNNYPVHDLIASK